MELSLHDDALELPGYSASPTSPTARRSIDRFDQIYSLENSKGRKWLSMAVKSRSSDSQSSSLPLYYEKDIISGRVILDLEKSESIKGIVVTVKACMTKVGQEEEVFLEINHDVWSPALGHPTDDNASPSKLIGYFSWPFSIHIPTETTMSGTGSKCKTLFNLPPAFSEKASPAYIDYKLTVTVRRPTLRANQTLTTNFIYSPVTMPGPPSPLRQLAYREESQLIGPQGDPKGWMVLNPINFTGNLFNSRQVEVQCTLAIATPLCYALGSPIPLTLTLASADTQALDVLASPSAIRLHLVRSLAMGSNATNEDTMRRSNNYFQESAGRACFWPSSEEIEEDGIRTLQGEIDVKTSLKPSFLFPKLSIRYSLDLLPFEAPGFIPKRVPRNILLSEKVTIATTQLPGVKPQSYAPPGYEEPPGGDYNKAMGFLENGDQRFYYHDVGGGFG